MPLAELSGLAMALGGSLALAIVLERMRQRRMGVLISAALKRHREATLEQERLEALRHRERTRATLPRSDRPLTPTFLQLGNPAAAVVSRAARLSGLPDPFAAAQQQLDEELSLTRSAEAEGQRVIHDLRKRSAQ